MLVDPGPDAFNLNSVSNLITRWNFVSKSSQDEIVRVNAALQFVFFACILPQTSRIPTSEEINLYSFTFDDFSLGADEMLLAGIRMFRDSGFIQAFHIDYEVKL